MAKRKALPDQSSDGAIVPVSKRRRSRASQPQEQLDDLVVNNVVNHNLPSPTSTQNKSPGADRKRKVEELQPVEALSNTKPHKRLRDTKHIVDGTDFQVDERDPVSLWLRSGSWSGADMDVRGSMKRTLSSSSRTDSYNRAAQKGDVPKAWTRQHAQAMENAGMFMGEQDGATIAADDEQLCVDVRNYECELPDEWCFIAENFRKVLSAIRYRNEARVELLLCPIIWPSAEMLHYQGNSSLAFVAEGTKAGWAKTTPLCGPKPTPDATSLISRTSLSPSNLEKLTLQSTAACEDGVFPFWLRQAKSMEKSIEETELQALHNASVAANTIIELYRCVPGAVEELHRRVLVFSMVHNHHVVRLHSHFAMISGEKQTFHRQLLYETDLHSTQTDLWRPYKISVAICKLFGRKHLHRIQDILSRMPDRALESFTARRVDLEEDRASTVVSTPASSQEETRSKRPSLSMIARAQEDNARLREQIDELTTRLVRELKEQRGVFEAQLQQQRQESNEQRKILEAQLQQQRQESKEQREEAVRREERLERQLATQQAELINLLKSGRSST